MYGARTYGPKEFTSDYLLKDAESQRNLLQRRMGHHPHLHGEPKHLLMELPRIQVKLSLVVKSTKTVQYNYDSRDMAS